MKVLVTGATGFVGSAVVARMASERRFELRAAVRRDGDGLPAAVERVFGDFAADTDWRGAVTSTDFIVHLAGRVHVTREQSVDPLAEFRRVNVTGALNLARQAAAARVQRFVYVSSVKVNGDSGIYTEAESPAPTDAYGISKHECEVGLREIARTSAMEVVIIRPPLVYGPGVRANFAALMRAVARGVPLPFGAIRNRRSLIAVDNLIDFIQTCLEHPAAANETFMVSDGEDLSTADLVRRLGRAMGRPARLVPVPAAALWTAATLTGKRDVAVRLLGSLRVDITKSRQRLGWVPPLSVDEGLHRTVDTLR